MFVNHVFAYTDPLPPLGACLYEYVVAANGVFARAARPGLSALIWVAAMPAPLRGLAALEPYVHLARVPARLVGRMIEMSYRAGAREIMFYLLLAAGGVGDSWRLLVPDQVAGSAHIAYSAASGAQALVELHSHHAMQPFFSTTDNRDETGFRLYAVIGDLHRKPAIRCRVGIYGHTWEIPARWVFDLPIGVLDAATELEESYADRYSLIESDPEF